MARILNKAKEQGLVAQKDNPAPQDIAQLIFAAGFSTAEQVTEVSGGGVGMDTVRGFAEREGGSIALELLPLPAGVQAQGDSPDFRPFRTVIRLPEKYVVQA